MLTGARIVLLAGVWTSVLAPALTAQEPPPGLVEVKESGRQGLWFGVGLGAGRESNDFSGGAGYSSAFYRPTLSVRVGGTVSSHLRLGGEFLSWINEQGDATESLNSLLLVAQLYPLAFTGLYLKGGLGLGRNAVNFYDGFNIGESGFAALVGAGYELQVGHRVYLNPVVDLVGQSYGGRAGGSYRERLINFGLGVLIQPRK